MAKFSENRHISYVINMSCKVDTVFRPIRTHQYGSNHQGWFCAVDGNRTGNLLVFQFGPIHTGCTIGSVTFLRNDTKYYEGAVAKNSSSHWVNKCRIYAYKISSPHQFLISHKLLFCYGANLGT